MFTETLPLCNFGGLAAATVVACKCPASAPSELISLLRFLLKANLLHVPELIGNGYLFNKMESPGRLIVYALRCETEIGPSLHYFRISLFGAYNCALSILHLQQ